MKTALVSKPYYDEEGYDTYVLDDENQGYAIFDGMGVSEGSRQASSYAKTMYEGALIDGVRDCEHIATILTKISGMLGGSVNGGTTAIAVQIHDGTIHWASCGDSRLYVLNNGRVRQVNADEGVGNILYNHIGRGGQKVSQLGMVMDWQKFMICSDGISGDWPHQFISDDDIEAAFELETPGAIAKRFLKLSKKEDDKTIIVGVR
jgi:serine/threonine protein phosphatase PrpC